MQKEIPMTHPIHLGSEDISLLSRLRHLRKATREHHVDRPPLGGRVADCVAATVGSWRFIIIQSVLLALWICANVFGWVAKPWDPYPFILLNLALSFQAAYTAPIIMMSQNRQSDIDREKAKQDYDINLKSELEIELLHQKIDAMRESEIVKLTNVVEELIKRMPAQN
jgi:uncharacterized membrane protein